MITYEKALELIEFYKQQIENLTIERDRLKNESANSSSALMSSNETNSTLNEAYNNSLDSFAVLGINHWVVGVSYSIGDKVHLNGVLYKCVQAHTSQEDWKPDLTPALWTKMSLEEYPEWVQPTGAQDAYMIDDKVKYNDKYWVSVYDNNVWQPGVYGWSEI